jgi:hypothetical protein
MRLLAGTYLDLDHNGAWHVFIAQNFAREWTTPAHPPLFLVLLKACDAVSHSLLSYRAVPVLAGVGSVFLIGRVLVKLGTLPVVAVLGALTAACAQTATVLSLAVESYTLAVLFLLASFFFALDLVEPEKKPPVRSRLGFALFASLALLSHYFSALFLAALAGATLLAGVIIPDYRRALARALPHRWGADLLTLAAPALVGATLYWFLVRRWAGHPLTNFDPTRESVGTFLVHGLTSTVNMFAPVALTRARFAGAVLAVFLAAVIWAPATDNRSRSGTVRRLIPSLSLCVLLLLVVILGMARRYPIGGAMRHQFLIFVFALIAGFVAFDRWLRSGSERARMVLVIVTVGAIGADVALNKSGYTTPPFEMLEAKRGIFREHLAGVRTVHLDRFDLIGLMMETYTWDWHYQGTDPADDTVRRYELTRGGASREVVAHWRWWRLGYLDAAFYAELARTWDEGSGECQTVFAVYQNVYQPIRKLTAERRAELERRIPALAKAEGFEVRRLALDDDDVYADLCLRSGRFLDSSSKLADPLAKAFDAPPSGQSAR